MRKTIVVFVATLLALSFGDANAKDKHQDKHQDRHADEHHHGKPYHANKARPHHKHEKYHPGKRAYNPRRSRRRHREIVYGHGGPPPWAPAHGYRYGHKKYKPGHTDVVYVAPFGIATGICDRQALGAALGATGGGLLGAELSHGDPAAIIGGLLAGAVIGGALADTIHGVDRGCIGQVLEHGPSHETIAWRDPDLDANYAVTPTRTYEMDDGEYCREYTTRVRIGGREELAYGTACRQPDGSWSSAD